MSDDDSSFFGGIIRAWRAAPDLGGEPVEPWRDEAACRGMDLELFFPDREGRYDEARNVCNGIEGETEPCPVRATCLQYGLEHTGRDTGLWGGLSPQERRKWKRQNPGWKASA